MISDMIWRKSSYSGTQGGNCVEVARAGIGVVAVRDSKDGEGPRLAFGPAQWRRFAAGVKAGTFDAALRWLPRGRSRRRRSHRWRRLCERLVAR